MIGLRQVLIGMFLEMAMSVSGQAGMTLASSGVLLGMTVSVSGQARKTLVFIGMFVGMVVTGVLRHISSCGVECVWAGRYDEIYAIPLVNGRHTLSFSIKYYYQVIHLYRTRVTNLFFIYFS